MSKEVENVNCPDIKKDEMKRKQQYLKDHIISSGFDGDEFANFIESERENGMDIENWTLEELETIVELFKMETDKKLEEEEMKKQTQTEMDPIDPNADLDDLLLRRNDIKKNPKKRTQRIIIKDKDDFRLSIFFCCIFYVFNFIFYNF